MEQYRRRNGDDWYIGEINAEIYIVILAFMGMACGNWFEYNPYELRLESRYRNISQKNIQKIHSNHLRRLFLNRITGNDYWTHRPDKYPNNYYSVSTNLRLNIAFGQRISVDIADEKRVPK